MKTLLLCLFLLPLAVSAQVFQGLPVDSATSKISYQSVIQAPGVSKAELYTRARAWAATTFKSAKDVLQMDDKEAGQIIAKGLVRLPGQMANAVLWRTITISTKDGRYRYEITDFYFEGDYEKGAVERRIEAAANAPFSGLKSSSPKGHYKWLLNMVRDTTEPEVADLTRAMAKASGGKEW